MRYVTEPEKRVPVAAEVDVVVAGAGVSGVVAAIASARQGAETAIIDRFGWVGGNVGPGFIAGGGMLPGSAHPDAGYSRIVYPGPYGIARELIDRYAAAGGGSLQPYSTGPSNYASNAHTASFVAQQMLEESGVRAMLSTRVADPIMDGTNVCGLFVEDKSGRRAVTARVVVDATGEADVARRAGAPILYPKASYHDIDPHSPTGMGIYFLVGGIDWERYEAGAAISEVTDEDVEWGIATLGEKHAGAYRDQLPYMRRADESGDLDLRYTHVELDGTKVALIVPHPKRSGTPGSFHGRLQPERVEELDAANGDHISALEVGVRMHLTEMARFWKRYLPGFEDSCVVNIAPFLGSRGGPCIEGEYTLTMDDCRAARRFDDVTYLYGQWRAIQHTCKQGKCEWADVPYRVMVPKGVDGLLATGRSASSIPDTLLRNRMAAKVLGEVTGTAAALSAKAGIAPRDLDRCELQRTLLDAEFYLGDLERLKQLELC